MSRYHKDIEDEITIKFEKGFDFQSWHHYCFVFSSFAEFPYPGGNVNLTNKVYMDGVFLSQGKPILFLILVLVFKILL